MLMTPEVAVTTRTSHPHLVNRRFPFSSSVVFVAMPNRAPSNVSAELTSFGSKIFRHMTNAATDASTTKPIQEYLASLLKNDCMAPQPSPLSDRSERGNPRSQLAPRS